MISADLIRVLCFPLQEVSDWISLARPSQLENGAVAEVSLYLSGVPARSPTPLFTGVRGIGILRSSQASSLSGHVAKSLSCIFSSNLVQHQFERQRPHPKISAVGPIEDADRDESQGDGRS